MNHVAGAPVTPNEAVALAVGLIAILSALIGWLKWLRPKIRRGQSEAVAVRDAILGRDAVRDSITGKELAPRLPGIGQRIDTVEQAVATLADQHRILDDHDSSIRSLQSEQVSQADRIKALFPNDELSTFNLNGIGSAQVMVEALKRAGHALGALARQPVGAIRGGHADRQLADGAVRVAARDEARISAGGRARAAVRSGIRRDRVRARGDRLVVVRPAKEKPWAPRPGTHHEPVADDEPIDN